METVEDVIGSVEPTNTSQIIDQSLNQIPSSSSSTSPNDFADHSINLSSHEATHEVQTHDSKQKPKPKSTHNQPSESEFRKIKTSLRPHLKSARNMSCFKDIILACAPLKRKQVAPKISPSPPSSPKPVFIRAPSRKASFVAEPKLTRTFSNFNGGDNKEGVRGLHRAASVNMGSRSQKAAAFAASKTMSSKDLRRSDSHVETPRMQRSSSRSHQQQQPIVFSTSSGLLKPLQVEQMLECTLDELCFGCVKQIEVSRAVVNSDGSMSKEDELLTVNVNPGWKKGIRITFPGEEDRETRRHYGDIAFVVVEKEHERFKRQGENEEDLEIEIGVPLVDAVSGCSLSIPLIGGDQIILFGDDIIEPGFERVLKGQGMARKNDPSERGDLKIKFHVEFPNSLTDSQRSEIVQILSD